MFVAHQFIILFKHDHLLVAEGNKGYSKSSAEDFPTWVSTEADKELFTAAKLHGASSLILADYFVTKKYLKRYIQIEKDREQGITLSDVSYNS